MARSKLQLQPASTAKAKLDLTAGTAQIAIADIRLRKDADTRPLNARHVVELAESIAVLGLLEPIVVDTAGHLLAGGHRLAALQLLAESQIMARRKVFLIRCDCTDTPKSDSEVGELADRLAMLGESPLPEITLPVQVVDVSGRGGPNLALAVEAAENNIRRQYTRYEIADLANRFKAAGYKTTPGKPKPGEKTMLNALQAAVGKSKRQIQNILSGKKVGEAFSKWENAKRSLWNAAERVIKEGESIGTDRAKAVVAAAKQAQKALE